MMWEFLEPCPPSNPDNYLNNPKYKTAVQAISMRHSKYKIPHLSNSRNVKSGSHCYRIVKDKEGCQCPHKKDLDTDEFKITE